MGSIHVQNVTQDLEVSVVISEIDDCNASKKEILNQIHRCYETSINIGLLKPILIQTQKQNEIRICLLVDQFETRTNLSNLKCEPTVMMANGLEIKFHWNSTLDYDISTTGYVTRLEFNEYEKSM